MKTNSYKPSGLLILLTLFQVDSLSNSVSSYFRITKNATVQNTSQTSPYLLETISNNSKILSCLFTCNRNTNCIIVVSDIVQNSCRLYSKNASLYVSNNATQSTVLYNKFLNNMWNNVMANISTTTTVAIQNTNTNAMSESSCNKSSLYHYNSQYNLCFYFDPSSYVTWLQSYQLCVSINGSLLIIDSDEKFQFARNLTKQYYRYSWVGSNTTIPQVFKWLDGSPINSSYWDTGEPNNNGGNSTYLNEGCVIFDSIGLADFGCGSYNTIICQF